MYKLLNSLFGLSLRTLALLLVLISFAGCSQGPLSLLTGGGPNVAANTQIGKTNSQTLGTTEITSNDFDAKNVDNFVVNQDKQDIKSDKVDNITINKVDPLLFGTLIFAFIFWSYFLYQLPSPDQIWSKRKK